MIIDPKIIRPFRNVNFSPYMEDLLAYERDGVIDICSLDQLREEHFPMMAERTALSLLLIVREIYREVTFRALENEVLY